METSTSSSPNKIYTTLCSSSPKSSKPPKLQTSSGPELNQVDAGNFVEKEQNPKTGTEPIQTLDESSFILSLQIDEETGARDISATNNQEENRGEVPGTSQHMQPDNPITPQKTMDEPYPGFAREVLGEFISLPESKSHPRYYGQRLSLTGADEPYLENPNSELPEEVMGAMASSLHDIDHQVSVGMEFGENNPSSLTITRREVAALTDVLGRISHHFTAGEDACPTDALTLTVVDDYVPPTLFTTSSQEEMSAPTTSLGHPPQGLLECSNSRGKRRRPKYSLTLGILKKQPVLTFSATGPLNADSSPHQWWCRVCEVELSLMSRGTLEMLSHYRSNAHLLKEHRIRMDVPGTPLYDKDEQELLGIALQEAKRKARETHPIAPQLDRCMPLVGQETVPAFNDVTKPTEKILFQISVIENGLRHGGDIKSLVGIYFTKDWHN